MEETVKLMLEHLTPEDNVQDNSEFHKQIRAQSQGTVNTPDDNLLWQKLGMRLKA
jgi:hypothetical protein